MSLLIGGCAADGGGADETSRHQAAMAKAGMVELRLVDAPADDVKEIVVTINKITAHGPGGGGWMTLMEGKRTIDLLKLQGGTYASLGFTKLPAGELKMLRLYVDEGGPNYVVTPDGAQHPLKVPSGEQSGIKIKLKKVNWPECASGQLTFDFDGKKSIHVHPKGQGAGDEWILRPVVRLKAASFKEGTCPVETTPDAGPPVVADSGAGGAGGSAGAGGTGGSAGAGGTGGIVGTPVEPPTGQIPPGEVCGTVTCTGDTFCLNGTCEQQELIE